MGGLRPPQTPELKARCARKAKRFAFSQDIAGGLTPPRPVARGLLAFARTPCSGSAANWYDCLVNVTTLGKLKYLHYATYANVALFDAVSTTPLPGRSIQNCGCFCFVRVRLFEGFGKYCDSLCQN